VEREEIKKIYEECWLTQPADSELGHQWVYLRGFLPKAKDSRILDAGCGRGRYAFALAAQGYSQVDGIDLFDQIETSGAFRYKRGSIDRIEFSDETFDFVYSLSVLYYLPQPRNGLSEMWRVLKPGGILVLSAHTRYSLFTLVRFLRVKAGLAKHLDGVRYRSAAEYCDMLDETDFRILDVDGFRLMPARITDRLIGQIPDEKKNRRHERYFSEAPPWMKSLRSKVGYHFILAAQKPGRG
jgi:SAM-dependent methyltransferase